MVIDLLPPAALGATKPAPCLRGKMCLPFPATAGLVLLVDLGSHGYFGF
jgi:hypothetical protein